MRGIRPSFIIAGALLLQAGMYGEQYMTLPNGHKYLGNPSKADSTKFILCGPTPVAIPSGAKLVATDDKCHERSISDSAIDVAISKIVIIGEGAADKGNPALAKHAIDTAISLQSNTSSGSSAGGEGNGAGGGLDGGKPQDTDRMLQKAQKALTVIEDEAGSRKSDYVTAGTKLLKPTI